MDTEDHLPVPPTGRLLPRITQRPILGAYLILLRHITLCDPFTRSPPPGPWLDLHYDLTSELTVAAWSAPKTVSTPAYRGCPTYSTPRTYQSHGTLFMPRH